MLMLQILTLFSVIVFARPNIEPKSCSTNEDCKNLADCIYYSKCHLKATSCATNSQCLGFGSFVECEVSLSICTIKQRDLKCYSNADCDKYFKCKESKCIADPECFTSDTECKILEHCIDYECVLNFGGIPMIMILTLSAIALIGLIIAIFCVFRRLNSNRNRNYAPETEEVLEEKAFVSSANVVE